jgi:Fe-S cluster assembly iron-binding protein IscA
LVTIVEQHGSTGRRLLMVTVTERAAELLKEIQEGHEESASKVLRLVNRGDRFEFAFDERREGDQVVQSADTDVLLVANDVAELLGDATIDSQDTPAGPRFTLSSEREPPA